MAIRLNGDLREAYGENLQLSKGASMKTKKFAHALLFSAACLTAACQQQNSIISNGTVRSMALNPSPALAQDSVNKIFTTTQDQLRNVFDDYEAKGEKNQSVSVGEK